MTDTALPPSLLETLRRHGQEHLLRWWPDLSPTERGELVRQIESVDFDLLDRLRAAATDPAVDAGELAARAVPPSNLVRQPTTDAERSAWTKAAAAGRQLLKAGRVAALVVAGGQGTRLGFEHPKGMFVVDPDGHRSLFQLLAEQVAARSREAGTAIPYLIMTSDATHDETVRYWQEQEFFGLAPNDVSFFRQGNMPAIDAETSQLLLAGKGSLATSPDGHGGLLAALDRAGLLAELRRRGIDYIHYHQVDNPTAVVCDPAFLGFHALSEAEVSTKVVAKRAPEEKMGVLVEVDERAQIIEYSDLPDEAARQTDEQGRLRFWAGNTAMHVFSRTFLERLLEDRDSLPFHIARKVVPYLDDNGELVTPDQPNAYKFERFIFDALPKAERTLVVEADRSREFNPVKNRTGADSPETARAALRQLAETARD